MFPSDTLAWWYTTRCDVCGCQDVLGWDRVHPCASVTGCIVRGRSDRPATAALPLSTALGRVCKRMPLQNLTFECVYCCSKILSLPLPPAFISLGVAFWVQNEIQKKPLLSLSPRSTGGLSVVVDQSPPCAEPACLYHTSESGGKRAGILSCSL